MSKVKPIYKKIETENVASDRGPFQGLPENLSNYNIAYVGKHKAIQPNDKEELDENEDFEPHLLIECRLFKEDEEIYIYPRQGQLMQRVIKLTDGDTRKYIEKEIQLRNPSGASNKQPNDTLIVYHYLNEKEDGYDFLRYVKVEFKN
jgi:hypothetical protein